eukprot:CAMPEP_0179255284 /NCGR_PEP_ID=MMETSP0797-20121207/23670_1 /TAXON_ID=47934 /ORGANISM="Dinophysis acuminata, Strain DAEP01" /LENGTH=354 /DNA_ID=CAMNT_0020963179 /DNA_START=77 /DNA_END=1141 /DNA_ORIENTATION=+
MTAIAAMMLLVGAAPSAALQLAGNADTSETLEGFYGADGSVMIKVPEMSSNGCDIVYVYKDPQCGYTADCEEDDHCRFAYVGNGMTTGCEGTSAPAPGSWVGIPGVATLADGMYYGGFTRAGNLGFGGASSHYELRAQNFTIQSGSVVGDPHVENMGNERFEIRAAGLHKLVQIPRLYQSNDEPLLLRVDANLTHLIEENCNGTFITNISIWGNWTGEFGLMHISSGSNAPHTPLLVNTQGPRDYFERFHSSKVTYADHRVSLVLGNTAFNIAKHYEGRYGKQKGYLNFRVTGLRKYFDVGGLLGYDSHADAEVPPPECVAKPAPKAAGASGTSLVGLGRSMPHVNSASRILVD